MRKNKHKELSSRKKKKRKEKSVEYSLTWMHRLSSGDNSFFKLSLINPKIFSKQAVNCCLNNIAGYLASTCDTESSGPISLKGVFRAWNWYINKNIIERIIWTLTFKNYISRFWISANSNTLQITCWICDAQYTIFCIIPSAV